MSRAIVVIGSILLLFSGTVYAQKRCPATTIDDCPEMGCGSWDPEFDKKRNLTTDPKSQTPTPVTLEEIRAIEYPQNWSLGKDRTELEKLGEGKLVQVTAYLVGVKYGESWQRLLNCAPSQGFGQFANFEIFTNGPIPPEVSRPNGCFRCITAIKFQLRCESRKIPLVLRKWRAIVSYILLQCLWCTTILIMTLAELRASIIGYSCTSSECTLHPHTSSLLVAWATNPFGLFV